MPAVAAFVEAGGNSLRRWADCGHLVKGTRYRYPAADYDAELWQFSVGLLGIRKPWLQAVAAVCGVTCGGTRESRDSAACHSIGCGSGLNYTARCL